MQDRAGGEKGRVASGGLTAGERFKNRERRCGRFEIVKTSKLSLACPVCQSLEVFYSCTPNCCFNHVCGECGATFEPVTIFANAKAAGIEAPDPLPEASDPTVACVKCDSTAVYAMPGGGLVCSKCGSVLALEITEVAPSS